MIALMWMKTMGEYANNYIFRVYGIDIDDTDNEIWIGCNFCHKILRDADALASHLKMKHPDQQGHVTKREVVALNNELTTMLKDIICCTTFEEIAQLREKIEKLIIKNKNIFNG